MLPLAILFILIPLAAALVCWGQSRDLTAHARASTDLEERADLERNAKYKGLMAYCLAAAVIVSAVYSGLALADLLPASVSF